eukprot:m.779262 g.779262  ORF g.779262 m.779262 type:complete len:59 (-) comp23278_c0_seq9:3655-3831(-)
MFGKDEDFMFKRMKLPIAYHAFETCESDDSTCKHVSTHAARHLLFATRRVTIVSVPHR